MSSNENPWADQESTNNMQIHSNTVAGQAPQNNPWQLPGQDQQSHSYQPQGDGLSQRPQGYAAPPGPPPSRRDPVDETARFVPTAEQGEQREALEQFEMAKHQPQSADDRNIETLTREFPGIDSALVAAIYSDSQNMGASREMLGELADQMKQT